MYVYIYIYIEIHTDTSHSAEAFKSRMARRVYIGYPGLRSLGFRDIRVEGLGFSLKEDEASFPQPDSKRSFARTC